MTEDTIADPFGLVGSGIDESRYVIFGDVDASDALMGGEVTASVRTMRSARLILKASSYVVREIDFTTKVVVGVRGSTEILFTGYVVSARPDGHALEVQCAAQPSMLEPLHGSFVATAGALDLLYAMARESGLPDERLNFQGLEDLPLELFEVAAPIQGLAASGRVAVADVVFLPGGRAAETLRGLRDHPLVTEFTQSATVAVTYVLASKLLLAEQAGVRAIDAALAWINLNMRYANGVTPDGRPQSWSRQQLALTAARTELVAARGLATGRIWLRRRATRPAVEITLAAGGATAAVALQEGGRGLREAALAAARGIASTDPVTRVSAISECLEFYAGSTRLPSRFTRSDRKALLDCARSLDPEKQQRVQELVGNLNNPSLLSRVRYQMAVDGVPVTEDDFAALHKVRRHRNDLVHGRTPSADTADIDRVLALLARVLAYATQSELRRQRANSGLPPGPIGASRGRSATEPPGAL